MATLTQVCDQIQATLEGIGLRVYEYEPDEINPPCCVLAVGDSPLPYTFGQAFVEYDIAVEVYVSSVSDRSGQSDLRAFLSWTGPSSIATAIFNAPTLKTDPLENTAGTPTMTAMVTGFTGYDPNRVVGGVRYFYAVVDIHVITRGDA